MFFDTGYKQDQGFIIPPVIMEKIGYISSGGGLAQLPNIKQRVAEASNLKLTVVRYQEREICLWPGIG